MKVRAPLKANPKHSLRILETPLSKASRGADQKWNASFEELRKFREQEGHCNVPREWPENPSLSYWVINQRQQIRLRKLSSERLRLLEGLGIRWRTAEERTRDRDLHWNRLCDALHKFLRAHGHCDVPEGWKEDPELARWVVRQRHLKRTGTLREDRLRRFEERGIDWSLEPRQSRARDRVWDRLYFAMREFRKAQGHCRVPKNWPDNPKLARWVTRQRFLLRHALLRPDRRSRLAELDFHQPVAATRKPAPPVGPTIRERAWQEQYEALVRFRKAEGHSDVPRRLVADPALARWASHQRELRGSGRLSAERVVLLDRLQFPWSGRDGLQRGRDDAWERALLRLEAYRRKHGNCDVPARCAEDPFLGRWAAAQRVSFRMGTLKPARRKRLHALGFRWNSR